ncbi:hypothetical protein [Noviherbaspirillum galbum]|uniref:Uncharacterized protein n=1 Tax=Noviherbaspirillum galbum TaxID=2709383 RepID=A0A6B3SU21_9BURK|nr:hypothetical protein [Noviherbaspirillum galbum]NEX61129.1 hypothetical protein [Noviherbaspirillum galbum]
MTRHPGRRAISRRLATGALLALLLAGNAHGIPDWPVVDLPEDVERIHLGEDAALNGVPVRMQGFLSRLPEDRVAAWFARRLGQPLVQSRHGNKRILGRMQGGHYITVQLEPLARGTYGVVAVTAMAAALAQRGMDGAKPLAAPAWMAKLPAGSRVALQLSSSDDASAAVSHVITNDLSVSANADVLQRILQDDGLALDGSGRAPRNAMETRADEGRMLFFKGRGREAVAVIARQPSGQTAMVINTVIRKEGGR